jgi:WD40 repeat protein
MSEQNKVSPSPVSPLLLHLVGGNPVLSTILTVTAPNRRALLSFDCSLSNHLVAAGCEYHSEEAPILFWDIRSPAQVVRTHTSTHSDDITNIAFFPHSDRGTLLSSSTDGLLALSNSLEEDEDEAVVSIANWGTSISKMGFLDGDENTGKIWAASDMETFSVWNMEVRFSTNVHWCYCSFDSSSTR